MVSVVNRLRDLLETGLPAHVIKAGSPGHCGWQRSLDGVLDYGEGGGAVEKGAGLWRRGGAVSSSMPESLSSDVITDICHQLPQAPAASTSPPRRTVTWSQEPGARS